MADLRVPDLNKIIVAGRLTRDPEAKYLASGRAVANLDVANTQYYRDKAGERKEKTCFVSVTVWDKMAEWIADNLKKGVAVLIEGRLEMEKWEDRETGKERVKHKILAQRVTPLEWTGEREGRGGESRSAAPEREYRRESSRYEEDPIPEDDIPF